MRDEHDGYVMDAEYPARFHRETTPGWLTAVATALGARTPRAEGAFTYLELGCGSALGTAICAAAWPEARFVGVDANPHHMARAQALCDTAGLHNLELRQTTFSALAAAPDAALPLCDFIVLHGVYAWVSPANRQAIVRIVERCLKPGGLVYVSYMSQPGAALLAGAQRLMLLAADQSSHTRDGALAGLTLLRKLAQGGAGYFAAYPDLAQQLEHMTREAPEYLAHEFLNQHWEPLHVSQVMQDFALAGCRYLGSATPLENIDQISVPAGVQSMLAHEQNREISETLRDLARNQSLRRDLYQREPAGSGTTQLSTDEHRAALLAQAVAALPGAPVDGPLRLDTRIGPVDCPRELFGPLLQALATEPQTYAGLAQLPAYRQRPGILNQLLQTLVWSGCAHPLRTTAVSLRPALMLNRALSHTDVATAQPSWLAAPVLGSAVPVSALERSAAAALLARPALAAADLVAATQNHHTASGLSWPGDATAQLARFERHTLPLWRRYGVVAPIAADQRS